MAVVAVERIWTLSLCRQTVCNWGQRSKGWIAGGSLDEEARCSLSQSTSVDRSPTEEGSGSLRKSDDFFWATLPLFTLLVTAHILGPSCPPVIQLHLKNIDAWPKLVTDLRKRCEPRTDALEIPQLTEKLSRKLELFRCYSSYTDLHVDIDAQGASKGWHWPKKLGVGKASPLSEMRHGHICHNPLTPGIGLKKLD